MNGRQFARCAYLPVVFLIVLISLVGCTTDNPVAPSEQSPALLESDISGKSVPNKISQSESSETVKTTTLIAPSNLNAELDVSTPDNLSLVSKLSWQVNSSNESGFRIERKTGIRGRWNLIGCVETSVVSFHDKDLETNRTYYYRVQAYRNDVHSAFSNEVLFATGSSSYVPKPSI